MTRPAYEALDYIDGSSQKEFLRNLRKIVVAARCTTNQEVTTYCEVRSQDQQRLRLQLVKLGFSDIVFRANTVTLKGNPFSSEAFAFKLDDLTAKLKDLFKKAPLTNGTLTVSLSVPHQFRDDLKRRHLMAGWSDMMFSSDEQDTVVTLYV